MQQCCQIWWSKWYLNLAKRLHEGIDENIAGVTSLNSQVFLIFLKFPNPKLYKSNCVKFQSIITMVVGFLIQITMVIIIDNPNHHYTYGDFIKTRLPYFGWILIYTKLIRSNTRHFSSSSSFFSFKGCNHFPISFEPSNIWKMVCFSSFSSIIEIKNFYYSNFQPSQAKTLITPQKNYFSVLLSVRKSILVIL